jgi:hypothetical protein
MLYIAQCHVPLAVYMYKGLLYNRRSSIINKYDVHSIIKPFMAKRELQFYCK